MVVGFPFVSFDFRCEAGSLRLVGTTLGTSYQRGGSDVSERAGRMRVVTLAGTKGGTGKTTLASALAVRAAEDSPKVALIDLDPQESLSSWWTRRGKAKNPKLFEVDATTEAIELLSRKAGSGCLSTQDPRRSS
jgi:hypothetical protein